MPIPAGSIVTAGQLGRMQPRTYFVIGTGTVSGAATNALVPGASLTVTTEAPGATYSVQCVWDVDWTGTTTATGTARLSVNGSPTSPLAVFAGEQANDRMTTGQSYSGMLSTAGTHTFALLASPVANTTVQGTNSSLLVTITEVV